MFFFYFAVNLSENSWNPLWDPFLAQMTPREAKITPRGPSGDSKSQKTTYSKKWFSRGTFNCFSFLEHPEEESTNTKRLRKDTQRTPRPQKGNPKMDQKIIKIVYKI